MKNGGLWPTRRVGNEKQEKLGDNYGKQWGKEGKCIENADNSLEFSIRLGNC